MSAATPMSVADQLKEKVHSLQELILTAHPTLPSLLRQIHTQLRQDPDIVTLLTDEETGMIVSGLKKQTNTEIAVTAIKGKSGKRISSMTVDDL